MVIGAVKGYLHDLGKNLVAPIVEGAALNVVDVGNHLSPEAFVAAAKQHDADVFGRRPCS